MRSARPVPWRRFERPVPRTPIRPVHRHAAAWPPVSADPLAGEGVPAGTPDIHGASGVVSPTRKEIVPATSVPGGDVQRCSNAISIDFVVRSSG